MTPPEQRPGPKRGLRAQVRAVRRARAADARAAVDAALAHAALAPGSPLLALRAGAVVALYDSLPTEPGTRALRAALAGRGLVVVLPVVVGADAPLAWRLDGGDGDGDGGAPFPAGAGGAAVVLLPALAVDGSGTRLGQGGGHYDRTLAGLPHPPRPLPTALSAESALPGALPTALSAESALPGALPTALSAESAVEGGGRPLLVAVVHDDELLPAGALPREPHDVGVDAALTPSGWHDLR